VQSTVIQVGSPEKTKWKNTLAPVALNWQITLAPGVANNFGPTPAKVENYHGPRHSHNLESDSTAASVLQMCSKLWCDIY